MITPSLPTSDPRILRRLLLSCFIFLAATSMASGQITSSNWTPLAGTWQSAGNWSNGVPTANTRVTIANGGTAVISGIAAQSLSVQVNSSILTIIAGGTLTTTEVGFTVNPTAIARGAGDTGAVTISGAGSRWDSSASLTVGDEGTGIFNIAAGGVFSGSSLSLGDSDIGNGTATVDGVGSRMDLVFGLSVGVSGDGTLNILNGAQVTSLSGALGTAQQVGSDEEASGVVTVDGAGSQWTMTEELNVGGFGSGSLTVRNGGYVSNGFAFVGSLSGLASSVLVEGAGSQWITTGAMMISGGGPATVTVQNGGFMSIAGGLTMTEYDFESATVHINAGGTFSIGGLNGLMAGPGTIAFNLAGGTLRVAGSDLTGNVPITLSGTTSIIDTNGLNATLNGTISGTTFTKAGAGTLALGGANTYNGGTVITGGALQVSADNNLGDAAGGVKIENGSTLRFGGSFATNRSIDNYTGAILDTNGFNATLNGVITGVGGHDFTKDGVGDLVLNAINTYTGTTVVNSGRLYVNGSVAGGVTVQTNITPGGTHATLGGTGSVAGLVTMNDLAVLSPGHNGVGTLTVGSLSLAVGSVAAFDLGQVGQVGGGNDLVEVTGALILDGSVNVNDLTGFQEGAYRLFNYGGTLTNNTMTIGAVPAGYASHMVVSTAVAGQVNLIVAGPDNVVQFWDGANGVPNDGIVHGGSGSWTNFNPYFADANGNNNGSWQNGTALFANLPGLVTVNDEIHIQGIQFMNGGYQIAQGAGGSGIGLVLDTPDGSPAAITVDDSFSATINANIRGDAALEKLGNGILYLGGTNTYTGGTVITNGVLEVSADTNLGAATGGITINYQGMLQYGASFDSARAITLIGGSSFELSQINTNGFDSTLSGIISGEGGLYKIGAGTLILTNAANSFELGAAVSEGILRQGAAGAFTANAAYFVEGTGTLDLNDFNLTVSYLEGTPGGIVDLGSATLTVESPTTLEYQFNTLDSEFDGEIIGAGSLVKEGGAILRLTSANAYTGGTSINEGTIQTDDLVALGTGPATVAGGILQPLSNLSVSSLIWNSGNVRLPLLPVTLLNVENAFTNGGGVQTFLLDHDGVTPLQEQYTLLTYGGPTNFTSADFAGELGVDIPNVTVQSTFLLTPDAVLLTLTAQARGPLLQNSAPVLIPTFADFFVEGPVRTGALDESNTIKSLTFDPGSSLQVYNNLTVTSGNFTVKGGKAILQGGTVLVPGEFHKYGAGTLDARSSVKVDGNAFIHSGALAVNGTFQTPMLHVLQNGTLMGNGTVIGNVLNSGTVAPGNSIGLLTIHGNYEQTSSGTLEIEVAGPGNHDVLVVSGHARLGGTLEIASLGYKPKYGDQIPFLRAGRITGKFSRIEMPDPAVNRGRFLNLGNLGVLLVAPTSYTLVATTPNQTRVARALDEWIGTEDGDIGETTLALDLLKEEQYPQAFEAIMPGFHEAALNTGIELSHSQGQLLHQQLSARRLGQRAMRPELGQRSASMDGGKGSKYVRPAQPAFAPASDERWSTWFQGSGLFSQGGLSLTPGENFESGNFLVGADYAISEHFAVGLFAAYGEGWGDYDNGGEIDLERVTFGGYATVDIDNFYLNAAFGVGTVEYDIKRPIQFATLQRRASSNPEGMEFFGLFGGGYDVQRGNWTFGPQFSVQYSRIALDSFTERGADSLDLRMDDPEAESLRSDLGARLAYTIKVNERVAIIPELRAFWQHEFLDGEDLHARLNGGAGPAFLYEPEKDDKDALYLGAGIGFQIGPRFYANVYYNVDLGREEPNHNVSLSATLRF